MHNYNKYNIILVGILAGAWPCGTIALVAELFGSESKSQVYGSLHTFVQENHEAISDLCKSTPTALLERIQFASCYIFPCIRYTIVSTI